MVRKHWHVTAAVGEHRQVFDHANASDGYVVDIYARGREFCLWRRGTRPHEFRRKRMLDNVSRPLHSRPKRCRRRFARRRQRSGYCQPHSWPCRVPRRRDDALDDIAAAVGAFWRATYRRGRRKFSLHDVRWWTVRIHGSTLAVYRRAIPRARLPWVRPWVDGDDGGLPPGGRKSVVRWTFRHVDGPHELGVQLDADLCRDNGREWLLVRGIRRRLVRESWRDGGGAVARRNVCDACQWLVPRGLSALCGHVVRGSDVL